MAVSHFETTHPFRCNLAAREGSLAAAGAAASWLAHVDQRALPAVAGLCCNDGRQRPPDKKQNMLQTCWPSIPWVGQPRSEKTEINPNLPLAPAGRGLSLDADADCRSLVFTALVDTYPPTVPTTAELFSLYVCSPIMHNKRAARNPGCRHEWPPEHLGENWLSWSLRR